MRADRRGFRRGALLLAMAFGSLAGCAPERSYKVLSFFFDGVPEPGAERKPKRKVSSQYFTDTGELHVTKLDSYFHKPFIENKCNSCHPKEQSQYMAEETFKKLCGSTCHEHEPFNRRLAGHKFLHGPVAVKDCLACHDAHESIQPHLILEAVPKLCYLCHDRDSVASDPAHRELKDDKCLGCHDPHGGGDRYFLKVGGGS